MGNVSVRRLFLAAGDYKWIFGEKDNIMISEGYRHGAVKDEKGKNIRKNDS
jgi:hypothetical protein